LSDRGSASCHASAQGDARARTADGRYVFTALHRDEADLENNRTSGFYQGTEIAVDQFVEHVIAMK
jgi:hypothetical protein